MKYKLKGVHNALKYNHENELQRQQKNINQVIANAIKQNFSALAEELLEKKTPAAATVSEPLFLKSNHQDTLLEVDTSNSSLEAQRLTLANENEELKSQIVKLKEAEEIRMLEAKQENSSLVQEIVVIEIPQGLSFRTFSKKKEMLQFSRSPNLEASCQF